MNAARRNNAGPAPQACKPSPDGPRPTAALPAGAPIDQLPFPMRVEDEF